MLNIEDLEYYEELNMNEANPKVSIVFFEGAWEIRGENKIHLFSLRRFSEETEARDFAAECQWEVVN
jgi:hypothetical protein